MFVELSALLYLGVLSIVGGLVWTFRDYVASLGDVAILSILALLMVLAFGYCFSRTAPYSNDEVEVADVRSSITSCISAAWSFRQRWRFSKRDSASSRVGHAPADCGAGVRGAGYRFDNRFVLSLALSTLAGYLGLRLSSSTR